MIFTTQMYENNILSLFQNLKCGILHKKVNDFKLDIIF
ncbi:hypothetical protein LEP1GSC166_2368 [Leptospira kirschneri]|nr:hypothetical protein LEP1GSC166_2368 [Leptospira kirschneri]